jgi:hypothetical protein
MYRRLTEHDFGIDGEVELTDAATGILLKIQVKAGPSNFQKGGRPALLVLPAHRYFSSAWRWRKLEGSGCARPEPLMTRGHEF